MVNRINRFMEMAFDPDNERAKEILKEMRALDEDTISLEDYLRKCLALIPKNKWEVMYVCFSVGILQGEYQIIRDRDKN